MSERLVPVNDLVTVDDIAHRLKMSVNMASNLVRGRDKRYHLRFPKPLVGKGTRAVWLWEEVEEWHTQTASQMAKSRKQVETFKQPNWTAGRKTA